MGALTEIEATGEIGTGGDNEHTTAIGSNLIDELLDLLGMNGAIGKDAMVGELILTAEGSDIDGCGVMEPFIDNGAIGPKVNDGLGFRFGHQSDGEKEQQKGCEEGVAGHGQS